MREVVLQSATVASLIRTQGGSARLAAIIGGAADAAFTNALSTIIAYNQGFPISWIATAYNTTEAPLPEPNNDQG